MDLNKATTQNEDLKTENTNLNKILTEEKAELDKQNQVSKQAQAEAQKANDELSYS